MPTHPLAAPTPLKGRGTPVRIAHRFVAEQREACDDGWEPPAEEGAPPPPPTEVREERATSLLCVNDSPDVPFELSINPYRGCEHGCVYCYARPTHGYLNLSPGLDFETRLVAKVNAVELLRAELRRCRSIGQAAASDQVCLRAWAEQRSRFFMGVSHATGRDFGETETAPAASADPSGGAAANSDAAAPPSSTTPDGSH